MPCPVAVCIASWFHNLALEPAAFTISFCYVAVPGLTHGDQYKNKRPGSPPRHGSEAWQWKRRYHNVRLFAQAPCGSVGPCRWNFIWVKKVRDPVLEFRFVHSNLSAERWVRRAVAWKPLPARFLQVVEFRVYNFGMFLRIRRYIGRAYGR